MHYVPSMARLNPGQFYVVDFNTDEDLYHERLVLGMNLANDQCAVLTPDGDSYFVLADCFVQVAESSRDAAWHRVAIANAIE